MVLNEERQLRVGHDTIYLFQGRNFLPFIIQLKALQVFKVLPQELLFTSLLSFQKALRVLHRTAGLCFANLGKQLLCPCGSLPCLATLFHQPPARIAK